MNKKVYHLINAAALWRPEYSELAKLYGSPAVAKVQLQNLTHSPFYEGSVRVVGEGSDMFYSLFSHEITIDNQSLSSALGELLDRLEAELPNEFVDVPRILVFDLNGQFVPVEPL
jgi:hypothetical protein